MTIAYYNGGVRVVDLSHLAGVALGSTGMGMQQLGWFRFDEGDVWAAKAPFVDRKGFYFYGNDKARGFDVYKYEPAPQSSAGVWRTPEQALAAARRWGATGEDRRAGLVCLLTQDQVRKGASATLS